LPFKGNLWIFCMQISLRTLHFESKLIEICRAAVPPALLARTCFTLLDWLGCIIAARHMPVAVSMARTQGIAPERLLHTAMSPSQVNGQTAALILGTLGNVLEMDDLHRASILHPGDVICAAAFAVALRQQTSGAAMLTAIVQGYEASVRIGKAAATGGYTPFYNSGTCGVFGAAISVSALMKLNEVRMLDALGQAGMQAAGVWQCRLEPTFSKQLACAHAARAGVFAAELAHADFPGPKSILTGQLGFFAGYYPDANQAFLIADNDWALLEMSFKPFSACRHTHPAISAAFDLEWQGRAELVQHVEIHTYGAALVFCDAVDPDTPEAARFSLQHAVAVALLKGAPTIGDFEGAALTDPELVSLRRQISLHIDPDLDAAFPHAYGARVVLTLVDGTTREAVCPAAWGDPENPMSHADLITKFRANAAYGGVSSCSSDLIVDAVLSLAEADDMSALHSALTIALSPEPELPNVA
jgi:2-methylcitrate dehydratase PrpD